MLPEKLLSFKIKIHPNNKQKTKILRMMNKCIDLHHIVYDYLMNSFKSCGKIPDIPKCLSDIKKITIREDYKIKKNNSKLTKKEIIKNKSDTLFSHIDYQTFRHLIKDTHFSFTLFEKGRIREPIRKKHSNYRKSYSIAVKNIKFTSNRVYIPNLIDQKDNLRNYIKLSRKNIIPIGVDYYDAKIIQEGDIFYIVVATDEKYHLPKKSIFKLKIPKRENRILGIDVNINSINLSNGIVFDSIFKVENYQKTKKKLELTHKKLTIKQRRADLENRRYVTSMNYQKMRRKYRKTYKRLINIKNSYYSNIITKIISLNPKVICIEDLDVLDMRKDREISKGLYETTFSRFLKELKLRALKNKIKVVVASRWFPSTKKCSKCGTINKKQELSERLFKCCFCNYTINRDLNAAINLKKYAEKNRKD